MLDHLSICSVPLIKLHAWSIITFWNVLHTTFNLNLNLLTIQPCHTSIFFRPPPLRAAQLDWVRLPTQLKRNVDTIWLADSCHGHYAHQPKRAPQTRDAKPHAPSHLAYAVYFSPTLQHIHLKQSMYTHVTTCDIRCHWRCFCFSFDFWMQTSESSGCGRRPAVRFSMGAMWQTALLYIIEIWNRSLG